MLLPDFCRSCSTDRAGNYNFICFQDLTEVQLRHWHSWVLGKRQGQRNSSYLRSFAKGGQKRSLTTCPLWKKHTAEQACAGIQRLGRGEHGWGTSPHWQGRQSPGEQNPAMPPLLPSTSPKPDALPGMCWSSVKSSSSGGTLPTSFCFFVCSCHAQNMELSFTF